MHKLVVATTHIPQDPAIPPQPPNDLCTSHHTYNTYSSALSVSARINGVSIQLAMLASSAASSRNPITSTLEVRL